MRFRWRCGLRKFLKDIGIIYQIVLSQFYSPDGTTSLGRGLSCPSASIKIASQKPIDDRNAASQQWSNLNDTLLTNTVAQSYTPCPEKRVQYCMCNFNNLRDTIIIFGTNHPDGTPLF